MHCKMMNPHELVITLTTPEGMEGFSQLLEQGFFLRAPLGCSVRNFICRHLDLNQRYLEERIQTIFLDHNPVDNIDTAVIRENSILALSAAMPGLAGATLRKGGRFAALRNQISCKMTDECPAEEMTTVSVKFFNLVAKEQGPAYLNCGIRIKGSTLKWFLDKYLDRLLPGIQSLQLDGNEIVSNTLAGIEWRAEVMVRIVSP